MGATKKGVCQCCTHPQRARIEDMRAAGCSIDEISKKFHIERTAIWRHWANHVDSDRKLTYLAGKTSIQQMRARAIEENASILDYLSIIRSIVMGQLMAQAEAKSIHTEKTAGRALDILREIGQITGEIDRVTAPGVTVNNNITAVAVSTSPGFPDLMAGLMRITRDHPEARADIVALLRSLEPAAAPVRKAPGLIEHEAVIA